MLKSGYKYISLKLLLLNICLYKSVKYLVKYVYWKFLVSNDLYKEYMLVIKFKIYIGN